MKVIITGGAGFIGAHLCRRFLQEGHEVICLDNFSTSQRDKVEEMLSSPHFALLERDVIAPLSDAEKSFLGQAAVIIHLASPASPKQYHRLDLETALVNSLGTLQMLELAYHNRCRFVLASTSEIYGNPLVHPQSEQYCGNVSTSGPRSHYDESKRFAETLTSLYHRKFELDTRIARIFNTYGPGMQAGDGRVIPNFITAALANRALTIYGNGNQTRSFCYISDLIEGLFRLATRPGLAGTIVNLGNPDERSIKELAALITSLCGSTAQTVYLPLPQDDPERRCPDITLATRLLDWQPRVGLKDGLIATIDYFKTRARG